MVIVFSRLVVVVGSGSGVVVIVASVAAGIAVVERARASFDA